MSREGVASQIAEQMAVEFDGLVPVTTVIHVVHQCFLDPSLATAGELEQAARTRLRNETTTARPTQR